MKNLFLISSPLVTSCQPDVNPFSITLCAQFVNHFLTHQLMCLSLAVSLGTLGAPLLWRKKNKYTHRHVCSKEEISYPVLKLTQSHWCGFIDFFCKLKSLLKSFLFATSFFNWFFFLHWTIPFSVPISVVYFLSVAQPLVWHNQSSSVPFLC